MLRPNRIIKWEIFIRYIKDELFSIDVTKYGYVIMHKKSGKSVGQSFEVSENASDDYVLGYAKCLARWENWIN